MDFNFLVLKNQIIMLQKKKNQIWIPCCSSLLHCQWTWTATIHYSSFADSKLIKCQLIKLRSNKPVRLHINLSDYQINQQTSALWVYYKRSDMDCHLNIDCQLYNIYFFLHKNWIILNWSKFSLRMLTFICMSNFFSEK